MSNNDFFDLEIDTLKDDFTEFLQEQNPNEGKLFDVPTPLDEDANALDFSLNNDEDLFGLGLDEIPSSMENFKPPPPPEPSQKQQKQTPTFPQNMKKNVRAFNPSMLKHVQNPLYGQNRGLYNYFQKQSMQQFQTVQQVMKQPQQMNTGFQQVFPMSRPKYITLIDGFINPVKERQPGGKDNVKYTLPRQVVELNRNVLPKNCDGTKLSVICNLLGFNKKVKKRLILCKLSQRRFLLANGKYVANFDDLIVKFSSHLHGIGGKLLLQFCLIDLSGNIVDTIESQGFLTITKRGLEKKRERNKRKFGFTKQIVQSVTPPVGLTNGNLLVKIHGEGFMTSPLLHGFVSFGVRKAREIISIKRNLIICETPQNKPGLVNVNVSLDGKSFIQSNAKFLYVAPNDEKGVRHIMTYMINPKNGLNFYNNNNFNSSNSSGSGYGMNSNDGMGYISRNGNSDDGMGIDEVEFYNFVTGKTADYCGSTILHHASSRGFYELLYVILVKFNGMVNVNVRDNYKRSALFWAVRYGYVDVAKILLKFGSNLKMVDDVGENVLHAGVEGDEVYGMKELLFWIMKKDKSSMGNTKLILEMLNGKNVCGKTPIEAAKSLEMSELLNGMKKICQVRVKNVLARDIQIRSGVHIGTMLKRKNLFIKIDNDSMQIYNVNSNTRVYIPNGHLAFVILAQNEKRAEFTLRKLPKVEKMVNGKWNVVQGSMMDCLSFFVNMSICELKKMYNQIISNKKGLITEFKTWSFVFKPQGITRKKVKKKKNMFQKTEHILQSKIVKFKKNRQQLYNSNIAYVNEK